MVTIYRAFGDLRRRPRAGACPCIRGWGSEDQSGGTRRRAGTGVGGWNEAQRGSEGDGTGQGASTGLRRTLEADPWLN